MWSTSLFFSKKKSEDRTVAHEYETVSGQTFADSLGSVKNVQ